MFKKQLVIIPFCLLSIALVSSILLMGCNAVPTTSNVGNRLTPSITSSGVIKQPVSTSATSLAVPRPTIPSPITPSTTTAALPPFTANLITIPNYNNWGNARKGILFFNNQNNFFKFSCDLRQHDTNGNFLSDFNMTSDFVPPYSHFVSIFPDDINALNGISINKTTISGVLVKNQPQFINLSVSNIHTQIFEYSNTKSVTVFAGTLFNTGTGTINLVNGASGNGLTPIKVNIQILKRSSDGGLTFAGGVRTYSSPQGAADNIGGALSPMPPPNEKVSFYTPLWQDITITDGVHAMIDGEITLIAPYSN